MPARHKASYERKPRQDALPNSAKAFAKANRTKHLARLLEFDREMLLGSASTLTSEGATIIGTDEVGRGCLAGPVVACAVVLPEIDPYSDLGQELLQLNDSKLVPPAHRAKLAEKLQSISRFAIAQASVEEIDRINILQASLLAMARAIESLQVKEAAAILIDGDKTIPYLNSRHQIAVVSGDGRSASIAAASVIAKVHRDNVMCRLSEQFPQYAWESNKGYGSKAHRSALEKHGKTIWHRAKFVERILQLQ